LDYLISDSDMRVNFDVATPAGALGALDPTDRRTPDNRAAWAMAGMLAGILKRTQRCGTEQRRKALADCLLFVSALKAGIAVGTLIAERPPHRSVRARLRHTAPTLGA
jgi:hypothetical protein